MRRARASCWTAARRLLAGRWSPASRRSFGALLGWLAWAQVDEVVHATGRGRAAGQGQDRQPPAGGRVAADPCPRRRLVAAGAPLVDVRRRGARSERGELLGRLQLERIEVGAARGRGRRAADRGRGVAGKARPDLVAAQRALLQARRDAPGSRHEALQQGRADPARRAAHGRGRGRAAAQQPGACSTAAARRGTGAGRARLYPKLKVVAVERAVQRRCGRAGQGGGRAGAAQSALAEAESRLEGLATERRSEVLAELAAATAERDRLAEQLRAPGCHPERTRGQGAVAGHRAGDRR